MEVVDAVDLVVEVHGEGYAVQTVVAHTATETTGMVRLTHSLDREGWMEREVDGEREMDGERLMERKIDGERD